MGKSRILIVDDEENVVKTLGDFLRGMGFVVSYASDGKQALASACRDTPDVVLLDIWLPGMDGIEALRALKHLSTDIEVIMLSSYGSINTAVKATRLGAFDYVETPLCLESLLSTIHRALHHRSFRQSRSSLDLPFSPLPCLIGHSSRMQAVMQQVESAWMCNEPVFIQGEAGCEQEEIARLLHKGSERREGPFVLCSCAELSGVTAERKLFGAIGDLEGWKRAPMRGYLELANGGTLLLERLDCLQHDIQHKLLQAMTTGILQRVGGKIPIPHNIRVMATSTIPLERLQAQGTLLPELAAQFRHLYFEIPPLRLRKTDIPKFVHHFLRSLASEPGDPLKIIDDDAMALLCQYDWPGNVEELRRLLVWMVSTMPTDRLTAQHVATAMQEVGSHSWRRGTPKRTAGIDAEQDVRRRPINTLSRFPSKQRRWQRGPSRKRSAVVRSTPQHKQRTLGRSMVLYGQGLQSGLRTGMILSPLPPSSGILFKNIATGEMVPASIDYVDSTDFSTNLRKGHFSARTVEHLMSALHAYRICNLLVKISDEVPIMDGSAADLCQLIDAGGIQEQEAPTEEFVVDRCYHIDAVGAEAKSILVEPYEGFRITYRLDYPQPLGVQEYTYEHRDGASYRQEIAPARTFAFVKDVEKMHARGLVAGGRLNNVLLLTEGQIVNSGHLRFADECARHKVLDIMGDLYLLGIPLRGHVRANMTGHTENIALVKTLRDLLWCTQ